MSTNLFLILIIFFFSLFFFSYFTKKLSVFNIFLIYSFIGYPLTYFIVLFKGNGSIMFPDPSMIDQSEALFGISLYALFMILLISFYKYIPIISFSKLNFVHTFSLTSINSISFITLTLSPILIYIYFYTFLNISSFAELNALRSGGLSGMGYIIFPITIVIPTLMQFWFIINFKQGGNYKLPMIMMLITCFFGLLLGFRGPVIALILQALFLLNICKIKIPLRKLLIFSIIGGFVFSILGALRYLSIDLFLQEDNIYTILTNSLLDSSLTRFRGIETFIILLNNAEPGSLSFLSILKEGSLSWIPSSIISKDISTTELVATEYFNSYLYDAGIIKDIYGGVSYGFIGESYIVFGISGILIYSFIYAFFFKQADRSHKIENISWLSLIFQKSFIGFSFFLVESPQLGLNAIITNIIYNLILLIILISISSFFRALR